VVVSRVTGGQPSQILGTLRSFLGESHFYFLNPWGVFFGANSSVDVGGSFHLTTADEVRDSAGHSFSARTPTSELLIAQPQSFGFLSDNPGGSDSRESWSWSAARRSTSSVETSSSREPRSDRREDRCGSLR
jgi:filamentous hemagglutinin family protein